MPTPHPRPGDPPMLPIPLPHDDLPTPVLRLKIQDLSHPGSRSFLSTVNAAALLEDAVRTVLDLLYPAPYRKLWPGTRSVTLILRAMDGVAYTRGKEIDDDHKEIHLSCNYVKSIKPELLESEITGVIVHEMVHCWQWNGCGSAPGGLIEGIADWVRLKAGLAPPHWKRKAGDNWDAGYQITAWFLDWLGDSYGAGTVPLLNFLLKDVEYDEKGFWGDRCGFHKTVQELWGDYKKWLADKDQIKKVNEEVKNDDEEGGCSKSDSQNIEKDEKRGQVKEKDDDGSNGDRAENEIDNDWTEIESRESGAQRCLEIAFEEKRG